MSLLKRLRKLLEICSTKPDISGYFRNLSWFWSRSIHPDGIAICYGFLEETSSAPLMTDEYIRSVRFAAFCAATVRRDFCERCSGAVWKTNLGPTQKLQKFYICFVLDKCWHLLMCWKNGEENTEKTNSLMSYTWWFEKKKNFLSSLCRPFECILKSSRETLCQRLLCHVQHQSQERQRCNPRGWMEI